MSRITPPRLAALALACTCATAGAGDSCEWLAGDGLIGADGVVRAMHVHDDGRGPALYIGGDFSRFADGRGAVARWNGDIIEFVGQTPFFPFAVSALATFRGELYAGGSIGTLKFNDLWQPLTIGVNPEALAFTVWNDQLIVGGVFNAAGEIFPLNVATWNGAEWGTLGDGLAGSVATLTVHDNELYAGGFLTDFVGGPDRGEKKSSGVARWDGETWTVVGPELVSANALISYNGLLHVASGGPVGVGDNSSQVAYFEGFQWQPLGRLAGTPFALVVDGQNLIAAGAISRADERFVRRVTFWDGLKWNPVGGGVDRAALAAATYKGELYVGGTFAHADGDPVQRAARWNGQRWRAIGAGWDDAVALGTYRGDLLVGGALRTPQQDMLYGAIRLAETGPVALGGPDQPWQATAFHERLGRLYGAVIFEWSSNDRGVGIWDGERWRRVGTELSGPIRAITFFNGEPVAVGSFTVSGFSEASYVARFDGVEWLPFAEGVDGPVDAAIIHRGELVIGGAFERAGTSPALRLAAWDGKNWRPLASDPFGFLNRVSALAEYDGELIAGGNFGSIDNVFTSNIAALGPNGWRPLGNGLVAADGGNVEALTLYDGLLIAGGTFSISSLANDDRGGDITGVAAWNGQFWSLLDGAATGGRVRALAVHNGDLVAAGLSTEGANGGSTLLSRWSCPILVGDTNCDGVVNIGDIGAFVNAVVDPPAYRANLPQCDIRSADANNDDAVNVGDIGAFVALLTQS